MNLHFWKKFTAFESYRFHIHMLCWHVALHNNKRGKLYFWMYNHLIFIYYVFIQDWKLPVLYIWCILLNLLKNCSFTFFFKILNWFTLMWYEFFILYFKIFEPCHSGFRFSKLNLFWKKKCSCVLFKYLWGWRY